VPLPFEVWKTKNGPIYAADDLDWEAPPSWLSPDERPNEERKAYSIRFDTGGDLATAFEAINRASDWTSFTDAVAFFSVPSMNIVYADVDGNVGYAMSGRLPIRSGSDGGTSGSPSGGTSSPPPGGGSTGGTSTGGTNAGGEPPTSGGAPDTTDGGAGGEGPVDACPNDDDKLAPGKCGCGVPESCTALKDALAHRYSFNQTGSTIVDSVGTRNGTLVGATASMGKVVFNGTATSYLDLPNGTISGLRNASFEIWLVWGGGAPWQRIFDNARRARNVSCHGRADRSERPWLCRPCRWPFLTSRHARRHAGRVPRGAPRGG
jgi:hypothetical protein